MTERSRTIAWSEPSALSAATRELSGLELFAKIIAGELPGPSIGATIDFRLVEVEEGKAVFEGGWGEHLLNPAGGLHGGWYGVLLDSAMGCAVHSTLPAGSGYTTLEYKVNITRGVTAQSGPLRAEGQVVHRGRRTATAEGRVVDAAGKIYAHGSETCLILV
ncbi:MAG TPA: PaaI family thioesterase [Thalassobaculum sp.]